MAEDASLTLEEVIGNLEKLDIAGRLALLNALLPLDDDDFGLLLLAEIAKHHG